MADQTIRTTYLPGQGSIKLNLSAEGSASLTADSPITLTELGSTGQYSGVRSGVTDAGVHVGQLLDSAGNALGVVNWFLLANVTGTYRGQVLPINLDSSGNVDLSAATVSSIAAQASPGILQTTTIATLTSQTDFTLTAGSGDDDAYNDATIIIVDQATATQKAVAYIAKYTGGTKTIRLLEAPGFTIAAGDTVHILHGLEAVQVRCEASLTSSVGNVLHVSAWLEWRGRKIPITGATCSIALRELSADANLFPALTESDLLGASAIFEDVFRLTKSTPGFTDDTQIIVTASITHNGRTFTSPAMFPVLGT